MKVTILAALFAHIACQSPEHSRRYYKRDAYPTSCLMAVDYSEDLSINSCAQVDSSWPVKDLECGQEKVSIYVLHRVVDGIMDQGHISRPQVSPGVNLSNACQQEKSIYSYIHGHRTVLYALRTHHGCPDGVDPQCDTRQSSPADPCNVTKILFCGASVNGNDCRTTDVTVGSTGSKYGPNSLENK